jgi:hypothetical protein
MMAANRREFLRRLGATLTGVAVSPQLLANNISNDIRTAGPEEQPEDSRPSPSGLSAEGASLRKMRGLMVDAARCPESLDYYRRLIEFCADWELNTLQFRLTDDQGSAMRFASVVGLLTHSDALTPDQLRGLAEFATNRGVELIPEVESFGHTGYITRTPAYAHLLDNAPQGSSEFTGIIPVLPETLQLFERLYREVASIFSSTYLHAGCDEVNWGGSALSRTALATRTRPQIWGDYLNALNQLGKGLGKQLIVWGDFVLHKEPEILARLDKNIIIMDWNYWDTNAIKFHQALKKIEENGSRGIGAPSLISYRWGPRAGSNQLRNMDAFAEAYYDADSPASLGVILTNWVPSRYIQNSTWDGFAYAAVAFKDGIAAAQVSAFRRFVERHYRSQWNELWSEVFQLTYDAAPAFGVRETSSMGLDLHIPWSNDEQLAALLKNRNSRLPNPFTGLRSLLVQLEPSVLMNLPDFQAFALSVEYLERMFWREAVVREQVARQPMEQDASKSLITTIAEHDRDLAERLSKDWDQGRSPESIAKREPIYGFEAKDQLVYQWQRAAAYSNSLALHPDRFHQLLLTAAT